jgi:ankyrin
MVERLIAAGADLGVPDGAGNTPLHLAVAADLPDIAGNLLRAGAPRGRMNDSGWSPVMLSQRSENPAMRALFGSAAAPKSGASLKQLAALQANPGMSDWSLLAIAAWRGELELIKGLVGSGADVSAVDATGVSPLRRAVTGRREATARYLIEQGADLEQSGEAGSLLHEAIRQGDVEMVKLLAQQPSLLNKPDKVGRTPLIIALQREDWSAVDVLLQRGALPGGVDRAGSTPLHLVTRNENLELARSLVAAGASVNVGDSAGRTPLWWASRSGSAPLVSMFLAAGALDAPALDGSTPVHEAARLDQPGVLALLADAGFTLDVRTGAGSTPLLVAAEQGGADTVAYLVERVQDVNAVNDAGDSPLICAARNDRKDVARILLAHGANPLLRNERFVSARDLAKAHEDAEWDSIFASSRGLLGLLGGKS